MNVERVAACNAASKTFGDEKIQALAYGAEQTLRRQKDTGDSLKVFTKIKNPIFKKTNHPWRAKSIKSIKQER